MSSISWFTIGNIDTFRDRTIIHISFEGDYPAHMPFSKKAIDESVIGLISRKNFPSPLFKEGYEYWHEVWLETDKDMSTVYTIPIYEALDL